MVQITYLHGSPYELEIGTVLTGGVRPANFPESDVSIVSVTSESDRALFWARQAAQQIDASMAYVYEVEVLGHLQMWRTMPKNYGRDLAVLEARCPQARITAVHQVRPVG